MAACGRYTARGVLTAIKEHSFFADGKGLCTDDDSLPEDSSMTLYLRYLMDGLNAIGSHAAKFSGDFFKEHLENAGFVDIKVHTFKVPYGHWAKNKQLKAVRTNPLFVDVLCAADYCDRLAPLLRKFAGLDWRPMDWPS